MCCGSFGKGNEGHLIACAQCGQCFHPYCVNLKASISFILLAKPLAARCFSVSTVVFSILSLCSLHFLATSPITG